MCWGSFRDTERMQTFNKAFTRVNIKTKMLRGSIFCMNYLDENTPVKLAIKIDKQVVEPNIPIF